MFWSTLVFCAVTYHRSPQAPNYFGKILLKHYRAPAAQPVFAAHSSICWELARFEPPDAVAASIVSPVAQ
jgi:hypothetical protein